MQRHCSQAHFIWVTVVIVTSPGGYKRIVAKNKQLFKYLSHVCWRERLIMILAPAIICVFHASGV